MCNNNVILKIVFLLNFVLERKDLTMRRKRGRKTRWPQDCESCCCGWSGARHRVKLLSASLDTEQSLCTIDTSGTLRSPGCLWATAGIRQPSHGSLQRAESLFSFLEVSAHAVTSLLLLFLLRPRYISPWHWCPGD